MNDVWSFEKIVLEEALKSYCYYKNNLDGKCAAAIIRQEYPGIYFIPINDHRSINFSKVEASDRVILLNITLSSQTFDNLQDRTENIIWIDHHKSTYDKFLSIAKNDKFEHVFKVGEGSTSILAWDYYKTSKPPLTINLISDFEENKYKYGDRIMLFSIGASMFDFNPESSLWELLLDSSPKSKRDSKIIMDNVCNLGFTILKYQESRVYDLIFNQAFNIKWQGLKLLVINTDPHNMALRKLDLKKFRIDADAVLTYSWNKTEWSVVLFTEKENIDVLEVVKKFGGNGHRNIASFTIKELPFNTEKENSNETEID